MKGRHWQTVLSPVEGPPRLMTSPLPCFSTKWREAERTGEKMIQEKPFCYSQLPNGMMWSSGVRGTRGTEHMENCSLIRRSIFNKRVVEQCSRSSEGLQDLHPWKYSKCDCHRAEHYGLVGHALSSTLGVEALQRTLSSVQFCNKVYVEPMSQS